MICETGRKTYAAGQEVDLKQFHAQFPAWAGVTYEYEKWDHRYAMMDFCLDQPKKEGIKGLLSAARCDDLGDALAPPHHFRTELAV